MISDTPKSHARKQHYLYSLYELSKDIDRNKSDHDFVMPGQRPEPNTSASKHTDESEIIYFVDSNIAIGFVTPYLSYKGLIGDFGSFRRPQDQDSQHDSNDHDDKHERSKDLRTILLMLSTEYIFSKDLVGKKYGLHLTPWHRQEVTHHLIDTHSECMRRLSEVGGKSTFTAEIVSRLRTIAENASPKNEPQFLKLADSIANEEVVAPLHLIDKILNGEFFRSDIETRKLTKGNLSGSWKSTINYRSKQKSEIKESTDSLSLSYMQWIADNALDENKRLVFITMDENLSDWYNHWFYGDHADGGYIPKNGSS